MSDSEGWEWAVVEVFGKNSYAGRCREEERFGTKMLRIDEPIEGDPAKGFTTRWQGGSSIFSYRLTTEEMVIAWNKPLVPVPRAIEPPRDSFFTDEEYDDPYKPSHQLETAADTGVDPGDAPPQVHEGVQPAAPGTEGVENSQVAHPPDQEDHHKEAGLEGSEHRPPTGPDGKEILF